MSRAAIVYFSDGGGRLATRISELLSGEYETLAYRPERGGLKALMSEIFPSVEALIFVGACGIAVRAIAPFIGSKVSDPAVIVADDRGEHVISLLSGHIGGANGLARRIAEHIGGDAVITTATDVNRRFSADAWAARNGLAIASMGAAKAFSAEILKRDLPMHTEFSVEGKLPGGIYVGSEGACGLAITCKTDEPFENTLRLIPRILHVGIGCRRGTEAERIRAAVETVMEGHGLDPRAVRAAASIDVKRDETGLNEFCGEADWPIEFYSADQLNAVKGEFTASAFVKQTVGVDNVCERAAMASAGADAALIVKKTALDGVTVAVAREKWSVTFE